MRKFDLIVLLLAAGALLMSLQSEGDLELNPSWHHEIDTSTFANGHGPDLSEHLPRPIVTDLDGDLTNEIVVVTRDPKIKIFHMPEDEADINGDDWSELDLQHEVSLLSSVKVRKGRQVVALATGYIHPYDSKTARTQVIVAVTEGWNVLCYDRDLNLLWERAVDADLSNKYLGEVAILITSHRMRSEDVGSVIVGARSHQRDDDLMYNQQRLNKRNEVSKAEDARTNEPTAASESTGDEHPHEDVGTPDHFSFYAFDGKSGAVRWKHEAGDFHDESPSQNVLRPQHESHAGEVDWRNFRYSILQSLPHQWSLREDTFFHVAHFEKRRSGQDRAKHVKQKTAGAIPQSHNPELPFGGLQPYLASERITKPNALIAHVRDGIEVLHLFTGRPLCRLALKRDSVHVDVNGDGVVDHVEIVAGGTLPFSRARTSHGIPVPKCMALAVSGIPPAAQLFNGTICPTKGFDLFNPFLAQMAAGKTGEFGSMDELGEDNDDVMAAYPTVLRYRESKALSAGITSSLLQSAAPVKDTSAVRKKGAGASVGGNVHVSTPRKYMSVFMINSGMVTGYGPEGQRVFATATQSSWSEDEGNYEGIDADGTAVRRLSFLPSVSPYRLRWHTHKDHIIAIGQDTMSVLSAHGSIRATARLQDVAVATPTIGDFNNDGWNDIIIVTTGGIYGYTLVRKLGSKLFILLSGLLFISLLLVLLFQWSNEKARARQPRTGPSSYSGAGASTSSSRPGSSTAAYGYRMKDDKAQS